MDAVDVGVEAGSLRLATDTNTEMQHMKTIDAGVVEPRPERTENEAIDDEIADKRLLDAVSGVSAGSFETAVCGQRAVVDGTVYPEQQTPSSSQHAPGTCPPDGTSLSSVSAEEGHVSHLGPQDEGGRYERELDTQIEASGPEAVKFHITCRLTILPDGYQQYVEAHSKMSVRDVIQQVAHGLSVHDDLIHIRQADTVLAQDLTLSTLVEEADLESRGECLNLEVVLSCPEGNLQQEDKSTLPETSEGQSMQAPIQVERPIGKQPFLGGYRNKETGVEYLNAAAQCSNVAAVSASERKSSRDTQTYDQKHVALQSKKEAATQMARRDLLLDESRDRAVLPKAYEDSEHWKRRRDHAVVTLQRFWRGWLARRRAEELRVQELERQQFLQEEQQRRRQAAETFRRGEIERRLQPRTAADFDILYSELEAWRMQETLKIKESVPDEAARKPALRQLLHKETKLLQTIDRLKLAAGKENRSTRIARSLASMAAPKQWELRNGTKVEVQTPLTVRAAELMQLYAGLRLRGLRPEQRLDVVQHIKWTVREFDCALTRELLELLAREEDLLARGRPASTLEGLRRRIANLFLQFIETPEFNPEAERFRIAVPEFDTYQNQDPTRRNVLPSEVVL